MEPRAPAHIRQNTQPEIAPPPVKEEAVPMSSNQITEPLPVVPPPPPAPAEPAPQIIEQVTDFPDVEAQFPGGNEAMMQFIAENLQYPEVSLKMKEQGKVYVRFVVEKDGSISNVAILRGVSVSLDREAKRVVCMMPKWTPGELKGEAVRSRYLMPIVFKLD